MATLLANTQGQSLDKHLFSVGQTAYLLIKELTGSDKMASTAFLAGCLHDVGKADPNFQSWIIKTMRHEYEVVDGFHIDTQSGKFSFEKYPRHNEVSLLLYQLLDSTVFKRSNHLNKQAIKTLKHVIYWHHAKPIRKHDFLSYADIHQKLLIGLGGDGFKSLIETTHELVDKINTLSHTYWRDETTCRINGLRKNVDRDAIYDLESLLLPRYKHYSRSNSQVDDYLANVNENTQNNLVRSAVITADHLVSSLDRETLDKLVETRNLSSLLNRTLTPQTDLCQQISHCLDGFEKSYPNGERNKRQTHAANALIDIEGVGVLAGPAGCGKTKISLEWALKTKANKIIWICPRVQVCQGLFNDLTENDYLPGSRIEINTGEFKQTRYQGETTDTDEQAMFSGDIVITTIDQITNTIITHQKITSLIDYMRAHIVFDEYHEYINMDAFNLLFAELVQCKRHQGEKARALLVSATPNYNYLNELLEIDNSEVVSIASFNESHYQLKFDSFNEEFTTMDHPLYTSQESNTFVISNTAITAQNSFLKNRQHEDAMLLHSKFKRSDKRILFDRVFNAFKRNGDHSFDVLRSGPIVQAALNISCKRMVTEFTTAENWLQRLGRLGRFGEFDEVLRYTTATPSTIIAGKRIGGCASFLRSLNVFDSAKAWYDFLNNKLNSAEPLDRRTVTIADLYAWYYEFYTDAATLTIINADLRKSLAQSAEVIERKVVDPISMPNAATRSADGKVRIKTRSLRGDNRFVQMAICHVEDDDSLSFTNDYAYDETHTNENLTVATEDICGRGKNERDLLVFMSKKHQRIQALRQGKTQGKAKALFRDIMLLSKARESTSPIYVSYTPSDLMLINDKPHDFAIYYVTCGSQPIGTMPIQKLIR